MNDYSQITKGITHTVRCKDLSDIKHVQVAAQEDSACFVPDEGESMVVSHLGRRFFQLFCTSKT